MIRSICRLRRPGKSIWEDNPGAGRPGLHGESIMTCGRLCHELVSSVAATRVLGGFGSDHSFNLILSNSVSNYSSVPLHKGYG